MFLILFKLISILPIPVLNLFSKLLSFLFNTLNVEQKRSTIKNLKHTNMQRAVSINESIQLTSETFLEYPYLWGHPDNYKKLLEVPETKLFTDSSNPKLIFTLHMGCVDVMLFYVSDILKNLNIIFTATKNKHLDNFVKEIRESRGASLHTANPTGMAKFFKNFLRGGNTIIATDLVPHNTGKYSKFFGQECYSLDIIEKLSNKKTHDLYFVYLTPGTTKKYKLNIEYIANPINTDEMNKCFERAILQNPEMYGWEYKKFKKLSGKPRAIY